MYYDYCSGMLGDWGTHHFHTVLDIMGYPDVISVAGFGGKLALTDDSTVPDTQSVIYQFPGWTMEFTHSDANQRKHYDSFYGIELRGTTGTMYLDRNGAAIYPEKGNDVEKIGSPGGINLGPPELDSAHAVNFLKCVRSRELPASDVELGHKATNLAHLGNIALAVGRSIKWDPVNETIPDDPQAAAMLSRNYREPYTLPEV